MNKQLFIFLRNGDALRGIAAAAATIPGSPARWRMYVQIVGDTLYYDIVHQDWSEREEVTFDRQIVARIVQNEMINLIAAPGCDVDPDNPPPGGAAELRPNRRGPGSAVMLPRRGGPGQRPKIRRPQPPRPVMPAASPHSSSRARHPRARPVDPLHAPANSSASGLPTRGRQ